MSDIRLSFEEVRDLTGYRRPADQLRCLHKLGYFRAHRNKTTGEVILERPHFLAVSTGRAANEPKVRSPFGRRAA